MMPYTSAGTETTAARRVSTLSEVFVRRPIATSLLAGALMLVGLVAYPLLPVAAVPEVDFPTIVVSSTLPGASPEVMAASVASPLERQLSRVSGLDQMTSSSEFGTTDITLQFDLGKNIDAAAQDVQTAISSAAGQLPSNLPSPPTYRKVNPADTAILTIALSSETLPMPQVANYGENIFAQAISQVKGVGSVLVFAPQRPAIRIQVDPAKIAAVGLDLEALRAQIVFASTNGPKGSVEGPRRSMAVYDNDQITDPDLCADIIVAYRNGAPVRIRDIGSVISGPENTKVRAYVYYGAAASPSDRQRDHVPAVVLGVAKQPGANVIAVAERVKTLLPKLQGALPPAIEVRLLTDRTKTIRASVNDVQLTLAVTIGLVVLAIFVFLRNVSATLIPSVTILLALLGTAAVMYLARYSVDNLSLMGLTIAVGFVVDDAIVMLENIYHHVEQGEPPLQAALRGAAEISFTIVSISLSLIAVFLPLLLMGGVIGRMMREFAFTVVIMVAVSVLLSLSLTPMLCARFLKSTRNQIQPGLFFLFERAFARVQETYANTLRVVLSHQQNTLVVFSVTVLAALLLYFYIPKGFFPQQDTRTILVVVEGPQDMSMLGMIEPMLKLSDIIKRDPDVQNFSMYLGQGAANSGNLYLNLRPKSAGRTTPAAEVIARLRPQVANVIGVSTYMRVSQEVNVGSRTAPTQYQYTLTDSDLRELFDWAPKLVRRLESLPEITDVASDQENGAATVALAIDRDRAAKFGIQPSLIDATIYDAIGQRQVAQYFTQESNYYVVLEITPELQRDPTLFERLYITSPLTGHQVPIASLVKIDATKGGYLAVNHQGQSPAVTISFNLASGVALGDAVKAVDAAQADIGSPATLHGSFEGSAQAFRDSLSTQPYLIAAALIAVYVVLGILYESYIHPLTILSTLPSAGVGALLVLWACRYELTIVALIAILLLIGIVKKNGIMIVDHALQQERQHGRQPEEAVFDACVRRFRPIMMTTMCALLAGVPLALGQGTGSEIRQPLGVAMIGGLVLSQMLTLFTTPVIYLHLDRFSVWVRAQRGAG